jgi:hypothetical protein
VADPSAPGSTASGKSKKAEQQLADIAWQALKREQNLDLREVRLTDAGLVANP